MPQILHHHQLLSMFVLQFLQTNSIDLGIIEFVLSLFVFELSQDLVVFRRLNGILSESFGSWIGDFVGDFLEISWRVPAEIRP